MTTPIPPTPAPGPAGDAARRSTLKALWDGVLAALGALLGLLPHVLHHVGFLAGTALVAGSGGTALFAALGYIASIPMLIKLRRRFGTWRAPALGIALFTAMFALSAFVVGPAVSGSSETPVPTQEVVEHDDHDQHTS